MGPLLALLMLTSGPIVPSGNFGTDLQCRCLESVLRIQDKAGKIQGSAVILGRQEEFVYALTANHVVSGMNQIQVEWFSKATWPQPATHRLRAYLVVADDTVDLALIKFLDFDVAGFLSLTPLAEAVRYSPDKRFSPAHLAKTSELDLRIEDFPILSVGCTRGKAPTCLEDRSRAKKLVLRNDRPTAFFWETERETIEGRSGGPLFNLQGKLIGICAAKQSGFGYYVHTDEINRFLKKGNYDWLNSPDGGRKLTN